jgi:NAD(P)H-hydrate epimerase
VVNHINSFPNIKLSIDIPSGLFAESNPDVRSAPIIRADHTWCFQFPKLAFMMPENEIFVGNWKCLDIGLHKGAIDSIDTPYNYISGETAKSMIHQRNKFSHKGNYGHALLLAGATGKMGAAILASRACMRSGVGLLTTHIPSSGTVALNSAVPEAMLSLDNNDDFIGLLPNMENYSAIGAGPGIGTNTETAKVIEKLIDNSIPMVLDADALNIIAEKKHLLESLPSGTILTPHPGEYKRLFGTDIDHFQRLKRMREFAAKSGIIIVLKGAHTAIAGADGQLWFNSTGNPGMATAGSGDVLTGIILSLLAQGYSPIEAAILGVYLHGLAGDKGAREKGFEGLIANDIIEKLPDAFKSCKSK